MATIYLSIQLFISRFISRFLHLYFNDVGSPNPNPIGQVDCADLYLMTLALLGIIVS